MLNAIFSRLVRVRREHEPSSKVPPREPRMGPAAIAMARTYAKKRDDIRIDPLETGVRVEPDVIAVRAWLLMPLSADLAQSPAMIATRTLGCLPTETQRIFYLSAGYGLTTTEIASKLALSRRRVRRHLLNAIAALDRGAG